MSDTVIDCGEILTIAGVGDLYAQLLIYLAEGKTVAFDCSKIERIDTASLQILLAYAKEAQTRAAPLSWLNPSDTFIQNAALLGLASQLNIQQNSQ